VNSPPRFTLRRRACDFFFRSVLTSNRHQTTWFCPSAATQLRAGLRLPIGCTTIQPVPRNESCAVPRRSRGLLHPSQVRRTTNATKRHPGPRPSFVKFCRIFIWTTHVFSLYVKKNSNFSDFTLDATREYNTLKHLQSAAVITQPSPASRIGRWGLVESNTQQQPRGRIERRTGCGVSLIYTIVHFTE